MTTLALAALALGLQAQDTVLGFVSENLAKGEGNWYTYYRFSETKLTIKAGDQLVYEVYLDPSSPVAKGGVDIDFSDGGPALRDVGVTDQNGIRAHGDGVLDAARGAWYRRTISLAPMEGRTAASWNVVFEGDAFGRYAQFVDNVAIRHKDGTATVIYGDGPPSARALLAANGYSQKPSLAMVPRPKVAETEAAVQSVIRAAEALRALDEVRADIQFARRFAELEKSAAVRLQVEAAAEPMREVEAKGAPPPDQVAAVLAIARAALAKVGPALKSYTGHLVGHAHIDNPWLWEWQESIVAGRDTFTQAVKFMKEFPGFTFSQSSSALYAGIERDYPELFDQIKAMVLKGQWEIVGGRITEADLNMLSPESHARQFLYGQSYFREKFGKTAKVGWEPDTFGHTSQMPQILKLAGCDYYYFCRGGKDKPLFWWQGPDGSRVLAFDETATGSWYNSDITPKVFDEMLQFREATGSKDMLWVYGVGNHGGGPTRENVQTAREWMKQPAKPTVKFSTAEAFFKGLEKYDLSKLPVVAEDLNTVFEGCYTSHAEVKRANRDAEAWTTSAEATAAVAWLWGAPYPRADIRKNWEQIGLNQFQDTLPGSTPHPASVRAATRLASVVARDREIIGDALESLVQRVTPKQGGVSVLVFNPTGWKRSGWIETYAVKSGWDGGPSVDLSRAVAEGPDGTTYPVEVLNRISRKVRFWAGNVPGFGYAVFRLRTGQPAQPNLKAADGGYSIETPAYKIVFDKSRGVVSSLIDKKSGAQYARELGRLEAHWEDTREMSAWTIGKILKVEALTPVSTEARQGPGWAEVTFRYVLPAWNAEGKDTPVSQTFRIEEPGESITSTVEAEWNGVGTPRQPNAMLRLAFESALANPSVAYQVAFAAQSRPLDGREYPGLQWASLFSPERGLSILNDATHGMSASGSTVRMSLIRASYDPDPLPNPGRHVWRFSIVPHGGDWRSAGIQRRAAEFNQPLVSMSVPYTARGPAPLSWGAIAEPPSNVVPTALKLAEKSNDLVMRMYEGSGVAVRFGLSTPLVYTALRSVNLIEDDLGPLTSFSMRPFQIQTVRLTLPAPARKGQKD